METLKAERTIARRIFSRACTALEQEIAKDSVEYPAALARMKTMEYEAQKLFRIDDEMKVLLMTEQMDEEVRLKEFEDISDYRNKLYLFRGKFESYNRAVKETRDREFVDAQSVVSGSQYNNNMKSKRNFKLPKIEQKQFDGELKNWLGFWGQFKVIDESPT
uniref:Uncharacterized protein n=1 Tax=Lygus hesperus TaxID=30085 RepID=A0A0K8SC48_LYGHE